MRKLTIMLALTFALTLLTACSPQTIGIDDHTWKMRTIIQNNSDTSVPAVGVADELYPDAPVIDLTPPLAISQSTRSRLPIFRNC